jgi:hypothetical protein
LNSFLPRFGKNHTIDEEEDLNGLSVKSRLIDIANGILSTQSISETAFTLPQQKIPPRRDQHSPATAIDEFKVIQELSSVPIVPSQERNTAYTTEYISVEGKYYEDPRYLQEIKYLANLAANVLAAMTGILISSSHLSKLIPHARC